MIISKKDFEKEQKYLHQWENVKVAVVVVGHQGYNQINMAKYNDQ
jgi:hypothetical protein